MAITMASGLRVTTQPRPLMPVSVYSSPTRPELAKSHAVRAVIPNATNIQVKTLRIREEASSAIMVPDTGFCSFE